MENYIWFSYHEDSLIVHWKKKDKRKIDKYQQYLYIYVYDLVLKSILCHFNIRTDFLNKYILDFAINSWYFLNYL